MLGRLKSIYEYTNFREYLSDVFEDSKKRNLLFSHRYLASKLDLSTPNLIWLVIRGKRNLTSNIRNRLIKFFKLSKRRAVYFRAMVDFLQAKAHEEKDRLFFKLMVLRRPYKTDRLEVRQYEYYSHWY